MAHSKKKRLIRQNEWRTLKKETNNAMLTIFSLALHRYCLPIPLNSLWPLESKPRTRKYTTMTASWRDPRNIPSGCSGRVLSDRLSITGVLITPIVQNTWRTREKTCRRRGAWGRAPIELLEEGGCRRLFALPREAPPSLHILAHQLLFLATVAMW